MLSVLTDFARNTWWLTAEMAPYLLLGFCIAGLLRVFFNEDWVRRHLGQKGFRQILKAVVIGIPLPLCSCGVIPVAAGIRRQGGERGAVAAFTAATPQTGVDAIAATVGMLGWVFTIVRVCLAFVNGIVAGLIVERWTRDQGQGTRDQVSCCSGEPESGCCHEKEEEASCCHGESETPTCCHEEDPRPSPLVPRLLSGFRFGLITLPGDLFGALVIGLLIAGGIAAFAPADLFASLPGGQFGLYLGMTLISLPLYVCSTGSIPMAFSFLAAGMSPGAVLIFLIAGPASNTATVTSLWKIIGPRGTIGYILSIILTAWLAAIVIDFSGISLLVNEAAHDHEMGINLFQHAAAAVLVLVLLAGKLPRGR
ncbi:MAG: SO_0444 family Cu/Zn efflux transporter [Oceanipulchritudo sp.]